MSEVLVIDMNHRSVQCFLCGEWADHRWAVPVYNGDVVSNDFPDHLWHEGGGGQGVCEDCFKKHERGEIETFDLFYVRPGFTGGDGI